MKIENVINKYQNNLNYYFEKYINFSENKIMDSLKYSLFAPCKRIRPLIMLAFYDLCGGESEEIYKFAIALEMIHTFSLIHDDLPCMDDAQLRRGKECSHVKFGESTALLAGDLLFTKAFEIVSKINSPDYKNLLRCINILAGETSNMIFGQHNELNKNEDVLEIYKLKTGSLFIAAAKIGVIFSKECESKISLAEDFGKNIGICFQMIDDILDKDISLKHKIENKSVSNWINDLKNECEFILEKFGGNQAVLKYIIDFIYSQITIN